MTSKEHDHDAILRHALRTAAESIHPAGDGLDRIRHRLASPPAAVSPRSLVPRFRMAAARLTGRLRAVGGRYRVGPMDLAAWLRPAVAIAGAVAIVVAGVLTLHQVLPSTPQANATSTPGGAGQPARASSAHTAAAGAGMLPIGVEPGPPGGLPGRAVLPVVTPRPATSTPSPAPTAPSATPRAPSPTPSAPSPTPSAPPPTSGTASPTPTATGTPSPTPSPTGTGTGPPTATPAPTQPGKPTAGPTSNGTPAAAVGSRARAGPAARADRAGHGGWRPGAAISLFLTNGRWMATVVRVSGLCPGQRMAHGALRPGRDQRRGDQHSSEGHLHRDSRLRSAINAV
jgi:hypothetical protein